MKKLHFTEFTIQLGELIESVALPDYPRRGRPQQGQSPARLQAVYWAHFVQFIPPNPIKKTPCRDCVVCKAKKKNEFNQICVFKVFGGTTCSGLF
jgi:hypothetical protein